ncbi:Vacuolar calcium ion transporter [Choanephora cucurbitarum]|uniref:Vacuolar calcium ion transporter n=1 Tax=Choanephora cucurbitarum TaxID=101091 RepID=A0A1C7NCH8_9FUNG|nr:Vacuolar calcium ion transporter [Choanephora cucurbitarum]
MEKQENHENSSITTMDQSAMSSTPIAQTQPSVSNLSQQQQQKKTKQISTKDGLMTIIKSSWLNVMLVFVPIGIASHFVWPPTVTFIMNFLAIVPLAKLLGFATEDIALRTGEVIGGLLNATFGNAVELIISIISLTQNLVVVVQASMLGSILSNLLLVLGMCFMGGGYYHKVQYFNRTVAQTSASLLFISVASLLIPASFYGSIHSADSESPAILSQDILNISRATSIILLILYFSYLFFQLSTHKHLFMGPSSPEVSQISQHDQEQGQTEEEEEEIEEPQLPAWMAIALLIIVTVIVGVCAEFLVSAIEEVTELWHISETFVGLILLPIVGNAAEHLTAVTCAMKNKMDLALGVAVGSSMQIALLVTPLMVIIGWGMNVNMSLFFNIYETAVLLIAVIMVNYLIMDGESNWLEGLMLIAVYIVIAISFYYYPDETSAAVTSQATGVNSTVSAS